MSRLFLFNLAAALNGYDQAEQLELQAQNWQKVIQKKGSNDQREYALDVTSTTACFLRAVAQFKREQEK